MNYQDFFTIQMMKINAFVVLITLACSLINQLHAVHNYGAHLALLHDSGYTYKVVLTTFTDPLVQHDDCELPVYFSDGTDIMAKRKNGNVFCQSPDMFNGEIHIPGYLKYNVYEAYKTFASEGVYKAWTAQINRNPGIVNIPNSANMVMHVDCEIAVINTVLYCPVSTVNIGSMPNMFSIMGSDYIAFMPLIETNGDSISYELDSPRGLGGNPITGYFLPGISTLNPLSGELRVSNLQLLGTYVFAVRINKWRNSQKIASSVIDYTVFSELSSPLWQNFEIVYSNLNAINDNSFFGNLGLGDSLYFKFYSGNLLYRISTEISDLLVINQANDTTEVLISDFSGLERSQPYSLTFQVLSMNKIERDFNFNFTVGLMDSVNCDSPIAISSLIEGRKNSTKIYPVPFSYQLFIDLEEDVTFPIKYTVLNLLGQICLQGQIDGIQTNISTQDLLPGFYCLRIHHRGNTQVHTVVKH
jgi:hypothetical protein